MAEREVILTKEEIGEAVGEWVQKHRAANVERIISLAFDVLSKEEMTCRVKFELAEKSDA